MTINSVAQPVDVLRNVVTGGISKIRCVNSIPLVGKIEAKSFNCSRITGKCKTPRLSRIIESHQCELYEALRGGSSSPSSRGRSGRTGHIRLGMGITEQGVSLGIGFTNWAPSGFFVFLNDP